MRGTRPQLHDGIPAWALPLTSRKRRRPFWSLGWFGLCAALSFSAFRGETGAPAPEAPQLAALVELPSLAADPPPVELPDVAAIAPEPARALPPPQPTLNVVTGRVRRGGTMSGALEANRVSPALIYRIANTIRPLFDFRRSQPGDFYSLIQDGAGELLSFEYHRGRRTIYRVEAQDGRLVASKNEAPLERRVIQVGGMIARSLAESMRRLGERSDLVQGFADLFVWDLDFSRETRPGDEFRLVVEKLYDREGFVEYGRILAAEYRNAQREFVALFYEDGDGHAGYFTPEGNSLRRRFLRAPVSYTRISARYSKSRLHPILKVRRAHEGVDYAAPVGTPVWAVADGEVIFMGRSGGFGRLIKVRHNNGYVSYYGHLSRYAKSLRVQQRVRQKQVIGFVGSTGLATGPHLDYRLRIGGRYVDPLKVKFPKGNAIREAERQRFNEVRERRLAELRQAAPSLVLEAAM
ncbi:MAG: peptidoglycan DD-metalloendopeptidase family protein [Myxococcota bacterium]